MLNDLRYAYRTLLKVPGFTLVAILTLALGIGANTAMFIVVKAVLLAKLPYPNPDQMVQLWETSKKNDRIGVSGPNFHDWHDQNRSRRAMASASGDVVNLSGDFAPQRVRINPVSREFFDLAGVGPLRGRVFGAGKQVGASAVAVIAYTLWQSAFQGSPQAIRKAVRLNGLAFTVVGVMPPGFDFPQRTQIWLPLEFIPDTSTRSAHNYRVFGRLKPGVSLDRAQADFDVIATRLGKQYADDKDHGIRVVSLHEELVGPVKPALSILLSAVAFVLLIACLNIANLQMSRSSSLVKELALRSALGAGRARLIRQSLTESVLLAVAGGLAGLVLAYWGTDILHASIPANIPRVDTIHVDRWVLLFTLSISVAAGLLFGVLPAVAASHTDVNEALREGSGHTTASPGQRKMGAGSRRLGLVSELRRLAAAGSLFRADGGVSLPEYRRAHAGA